jgi:PIN domain nuclease of toxin-antitoxin system
MVDTTYLLPAAGIAVGGTPQDAIGRIRDAGHETFASEISLFELLAKGAKLVSEGKADPGRVSLALKSIISDDSIKKVKVYTDETMSIAMELRGHHSDFVDCLILASAASECDVLVTEDASIQRSDGLTKVMVRRKPGFRNVTLKGLLGPKR